MPDAREVEERRRDDDPEAVALPERARRARARPSPRGRADAELKTPRPRRRNAAVTTRPQSHCGPTPLCPPRALRRRDEPHGDRRASAGRELAERRRRRDLLVRVVERAEEIHDPPRGDADEERAERNAPAKLRIVRHEEKCTEAPDDRGNPAA